MREDDLRVPDVFSDSATVQLGPKGVMLAFQRSVVLATQPGQEQPQQPAVPIVLVALVRTTLQQAKELAYSLTTSIRTMEQTQGVRMVIPDSMLGDANAWHQFWGSKPDEDTGPPKAEPEDSKKPAT